MMLDIRLIRENPDLVKTGVSKKNNTVDIDNLLTLDEQRREIIRQVEALKSERNTVSAEIAKKKKAKEPADDAIAAMKEVGQKIGKLDNDLRELDQKFHDLMIWIPNIPHESVPVGDETNNELVREWGEISKPDFKVKPHWEIGQELGVFDQDASVRLSGSGFYVLRGLGAALERALINFMLDIHTSDGYQEASVPFLVNWDTMFGTGQLPKMDDDMYRTDPDHMYLIPTAEVSLTNLYRDSIISYEDLPLSLVSASPCFRREAGAAGKDTRGMLRVHQFLKVELVKIVRPEESYKVLEELLTQAAKILELLKLPYRVLTLATGDLSFASAKTYDIEVWSAGVEKWLEISSVSNFEDFQARRMKCRFRDEDKKNQFVHTLNGSGLALARLIPAIFENYQNADGTITVPEVLRPYMNGIERIG
jgi:seryl-tRNA synthetase